MSHDPDPPLADPASRTVTATACEVSLENPSRHRGVAVRRLRPWLRDLVAELAPGAGSFAVRLVTDREMARLNGIYRGKPRPTDVLSFPGERAAGEHLGDVAVAVPTARRQARDLGRTTEEELRVLMLHGLLHCLGYDHETDDGTMERLEERLRERWVSAGGSDG